MKTPDIEEAQGAPALGQATYIPKETALRALEGLKRAYRRLTLFGVGVIAGILLILGTASSKNWKRLRSLG